MFYADNVVQVGENTLPKVLKADSFLLWQKLAIARAGYRVVSGDKVDNVAKKGLVLRAFQTNVDLILKDYCKSIPQHRKS